MMVIEFHCFNLMKRNEKNYNIAFLLISPYTTYFHQFLIRVSFSPILNTNVSSESENLNFQMYSVDTE